MFSRTYEFRLKPTKQQQEIFEHWLAINRRVYHYALAERKDWYRSRSSSVNACSIISEYIILADTPTPNYVSQCKSLSQAKETNPELKIVQFQVLQQKIKRLENAFTSMWEQGLAKHCLEAGWSQFFGMKESSHFR